MESNIKDKKCWSGLLVTRIQSTDKPRCQTDARRDTLPTVHSTTLLPLLLFFLDYKTATQLKTGNVDVFNTVYHHWKCLKFKLKNLIGFTYKKLLQVPGSVSCGNRARQSFGSNLLLRQISTSKQVISLC